VVDRCRRPPERACARSHAAALSDLNDETIAVGGLELSLLRPREPYDLLDEEAFAQDEFMPYWAELWPSGLALARALPERMDGVRAVDLGCGLGVPALAAAARGAEVTAVDWAAEAIALLEQNATRNGISLSAVHADWRAFTGSFDLVLGADLLYERRNVEALLGVLPALAPEVLLADPGRPYAAEFFRLAGEDWAIDELPERVYRLTRATPGGQPAPPVARGATAR
jgi:predicted nicotinamide N-methyase